MFIAMNRFQVNPGKEADFEEIWRTRETFLQEMPGFVRFALLRSDNPGEYISHSTWQNRDVFVAWTQSEAFTRAHKQGSLMGVLQGPPQVSLYEAILEQDTVTA